MVWPCFFFCMSKCCISVYSIQQLPCHQAINVTLATVHQSHYHERNNAVDGCHVPTKRLATPEIGSETWISSLACEPWVSLLASQQSVWKSLSVGQPSAHLHKPAPHGSPVENMQPILLHAGEKSPHQYSPSIIKPISTLSQWPCLSS